MGNANDIKALFIIVNAGFTDDIMEIIRAEGAGGATIINARGEGALHKSFMGITVDSEKEIVLSLVGGETSERIMASIKKTAGLKTPANGICFSMPVDRMTDTNKYAPQGQDPGKKCSDPK